MSPAPQERPKFDRKMLGFLVVTFFVGWILFDQYIESIFSTPSRAPEAFKDDRAINWREPVIAIAGTIVCSDIMQVYRSASADENGCFQLSSDTKVQVTLKGAQGIDALRVLEGPHTGSLGWTRQPQLED